jgi:hypothetical protein
LLERFVQSNENFLFISHKTRKPGLCSGMQKAGAPQRAPGCRR